MARSGPDKAHFSSILQLVSSPQPRSTDFDSMEDVHDLNSFAAASTESISDTGHSISSSTSTSRSFSTPLLGSASFQPPPLSFSNLPIPNFLPKRKGSKRLRTHVRHSVDYGSPVDAPNQALPSSKLLMRSKSFNGSSSQSTAASRGQERLPAVDEALSSAPFSDVSHRPSTSPLPTPRTHRTARQALRADPHTRRKSLDLSPNMMQASIRRLKRSPSFWTAGDRSLPVSEARDQHIHNLRAEPQLSDQQKNAALRRARKIAQVFGSEAPTALVQGGHLSQRISTDSRDSLSTILSTDVPPLVEPTQRHSNSNLPTLLSESTPRPSTPLDQSRPALDVISINDTEASSSLCPPPSFSERRRRAAKLTQFFGVSYQNISQSIADKILPPLPKHASPGANNIPVVEVDVKVAGRRFWGLVDGEMKNADVADVIDKLRGLRAA